MPEPPTQNGKTDERRPTQDDVSLIHQEFPDLSEYEFVSYEEVDFGQKEEIDRLLRKVIL